MKVINTEIKGVYIIEPRLFKKEVISSRAFRSESLTRRLVTLIFARIMRV